MISILVGAISIGLIAGMPLTDIVASVNEGIGNTLKGIALLVGLGFYVRRDSRGFRRRTDAGCHDGTQIR